MRVVVLAVALLSFWSWADPGRASQARGEAGERTVITVLHTNDMHGHLRPWRGWEGELRGQSVGGAERLATAIAQVRGESANVLLLDAGDLWGDSMIAHLTEGQALLRVLQALQYDAAVIGNHEPDFGGETLAARAKAAPFAVLAANLKHKDTGDLVTRPHLVKNLDGVRVGIFGLAYPKTEWTTAPKNVADLVFEHPVETARKSVRELRDQGAQIIIGLTHLGLGADIRLAGEVEGIDVIVGGHSHNRMHKAHRVNDTLIVQAGAHGSDLGRLDLVVEDGRVVEHNRTLYPLVDQTPDPAMSRLVDQIHAPYREQLDEKIGEAASWLVRAQTLAGQEKRKRDEQSPVDSLFADVVRRTTAADLAFLPGVGYGVAIPPGPITAHQLRQLVPHEGRIVTMQLSGSEVRDILEQAVENVFTEDVDQKVGGMIQLSGIRFRYDSRRPPGKRVVEIQTEAGDWSDEREYRVATNSMLAAGGHRQMVFTRGRQVREHGNQFEVLKQWFQNEGPMQTPEDVRIRRADEPQSAEGRP